MSGSQKVLRFLGILDIVMCGVAFVAMILGKGEMSVISMILSVIEGCLFLIAASDASKYFGAWLFSLVQVILGSVATGLVVGAIFLNKAEMTYLIASGIALALSVIGYIAANNVRKQAKKEHFNRTPMPY